MYFTSKKSRYSSFLWIFPAENRCIVVSYGCDRQKVAVQLFETQLRRTVDFMSIVRKYLKYTVTTNVYTLCYRHEKLKYHNLDAKYNIWYNSIKRKDHVHRVHEHNNMMKLKKVLNWGRRGKFWTF